VTFDPRQLFLVDALGAVVTAVLLTAVVAQFERAFGIPSRVVYVLAAIAAGFAVYSFTCYLTRPRNWPKFLRMIAIANLSYCLLTLIVLFVYRFEVTALGIGYFVGEVAIVAGLVVFELLTVRRAADR
jgi:ABC-type uncharacterized transport system permease subunit